MYFLLNTLYFQTHGVGALFSCRRCCQDFREEQPYLAQGHTAQRCESLHLLVDLLSLQSGQLNSSLKSTRQQRTQASYKTGQQNKSVNVSSPLLPVCVCVCFCPSVCLFPLFPSLFTISFFPGFKTLVILVLKCECPMGIPGIQAT